MFSCFLQLLTRVTVKEIIAIREKRREGNQNWSQIFKWKILFGWPVSFLFLQTFSFPFISSPIFHAAMVKALLKAIVLTFGFAVISICGQERNIRRLKLWQVLRNFLSSLSLTPFLFFLLLWLILLQTMWSNNCT